jgi:hypothetical protein
MMLHFKQFRKQIETIKFSNPICLKKTFTYAWPYDVEDWNDGFFSYYFHQSFEILRNLPNIIVHLIMFSLKKR